MTRIACSRSLLCLLAMLAFFAPASAKRKEQVLYSFQGGSDGATPVGAVVFDRQGNLYGVTQAGGATNCAPMADCGTVYQLVPNGDGSWTETVLYVFKGKSSNDGEYPEGGLVADSSGNLYGTTAYGGTGSCVLLGVLGGCGAVFEMSPPEQQGGAWTETILYSFKGGKDGYVPVGDLMLDGAGNLYGATSFGGGRGTTCDPFYQYCGTVFRLSPPKTNGGKWTEEVLHSFVGVANGQQAGDGANPNGGLIVDGKGAIYGTTYYGGDNQKGTCEGGAWGTGCGIVFKLIPTTKKRGSWVEKVLYSFHGGSADGANPPYGASFDAKGNLVGATYGGPQNGFGTIFELAKPMGKAGLWKETLLYRFTDQGDGGYPSSGLRFDTSGNLYGTASAGASGGTVFRMMPPRRKSGSWRLKPLHNFAGLPDGIVPNAVLLSDSVGDLYSTTKEGGTGVGCTSNGCGTVFELEPQGEFGTVK